MRRASAYNRSLIEASLDPLVTISPDGKITDVNEATEKSPGVARERADRHATSPTTSPSPRRPAQGYQQVFREGLGHGLSPGRSATGTGARSTCSTTPRSTEDEAGEVLGVFAAARDVTARSGRRRRCAGQLTTAA